MANKDFLKEVELKNGTSAYISLSKIVNKMVVLSIDGTQQSYSIWLTIDEAKKIAETLKEATDEVQ